jgi:hypothetical protein
VAVLSGPNQRDVCISVDKQLAGFEHALHVRQSTTRGLITECLKFDFERHLQSSRKGREKLERHNRYMCSNACSCSVPVCLECGNSRCDSVSSSGEPDLSCAHLAHQHQQHRDETQRRIVCATRARCQRCAPACVQQRAR